MPLWLMKCMLTVSKNISVQYLAVLNGADAIIFTAGIGENAANVREDVISGISGLAVMLIQKRTSLV